MLTRCCVVYIPIYVHIYIHTCTHTHIQINVYSRILNNLSTTIISQIKYLSYIHSLGGNPQPSRSICRDRSQKVVHVSSARSEDFCHPYQGNTGIVVVLLGQCR